MSEPERFEGEPCLEWQEKLALYFKNSVESSLRMNGDWDYSQI